MTKRIYIYVANSADKVISQYWLDTNKDELRLISETPAELRVMPMLISPDQAYLYAAIRSEPFKLVSYRIDASSGALSKQAEVMSSYSMANIGMDRSGRFLLSCSYGDDLVGVNPIRQNGLVGEMQQVVQTQRHAHAVHASPDNSFVFVSCLGDDQIMQYRFDHKTGKLTANNPASVATTMGSGPRHFSFSPCGDYLYVLGETSGSVATYSYDSVTGLLTFLAETTGLPLSLFEPVAEGQRRIWATDIHLSPDGRFLYLSEVTKSIVTVLSIDSNNGLPSYQGYVEVESHPRGFNLTKDGKYLIVAGTQDTHIGLYQLESETGFPVRVNQASTAQGANWVEVVELSGCS
ncbi:lactonase family protein [Marinomonas transparens]|uniref:Beta-propeller fold lactonase family protein n=1 Tax=Marinomonas transparens TaxID=2795388 RepID=A0A934N1E3_9GAMM|nr:beta-propeller fold lactonase family protein [Marinomonas transparens]MBJ7539425.1 beta-propeller fold lactonase family protein [Marinomonas transparens]